MITAWPFGFTSVKELPMQAKSATTTSQTKTRTKRKPALPPICYFCSSTDTMVPFLRGSRIFLVSSVFPRLRWRFCRHCRKHFLHVADSHTA
jgi:ribosomal protein L44E